jgi:hypothetical protein
MVCVIASARDTKMGVRRLALLLTVALIFTGCSTTDFQSWEGRNSVIEGQGGTKKVVDGMDVWTNGDPPRQFRILGVIDDERSGGLIPMAKLKHDIVKKAREHGGNAGILLSSSSQLAGYYTASTANAQFYGNSAVGFGSTTTVPFTRRASKFVVIKYLE